MPYCTFTQRDSGHWHCPTCGYISKRPYDQPPKKECGPAGEPRKRRPPGVGDHLFTLIHSLGISPTKNCGCAKLRQEMNALGPQGCREQRERLVAALTEKSWQYSPRDTLRAAWAAMMSAELRNVINPLDRFGSLLDAAIAKAEAEATTEAALGP